MSWNKLTGAHLQSGWAIGPMRPIDPGDTGGNFSVQFLAEKNQQKAFLKIFDTQRLFDVLGGDLTQLQRELESINFETMLLGMCQRAGTRAVVVPIEIGKFDFPGVNGDRPIQYILFELGDQDVRRYHNYRPEVDYVTNLAILRQVASGLHELHELTIAHQDIKPSNVVMFPENVSRIADLGRSSNEELTSEFRA